MRHGVLSLRRTLAPSWLGRAARATRRALLPLAAVGLIASAWGQTPPAPIDRIKPSDGELSCAQIHAEIGQMEKIVAEAQAGENKEKGSATAAGAAGTVAEVAGRTGLFGAIGGVAGALFGQAAAQAGAGAVQKSAQDSAQQMAQRSKQAMARKEHLTAMFLARECKVSDLNAPGKPLSAAEMQKLTQAAPAGAGATPAEPPVTPPPADAAAAAALVDKVAPAALAGPLPQLSTTAGGGGSTVKSVVAKAPKVVVAGFHVAFIDKTGTYASGQGRSTSSWNTRGDMKTIQITNDQSKGLALELTNVSPALMQAITDRLYADFIEQLKAKGLEVLPREALSQSQHFSSRVKFSRPKEGPVYVISPMGNPNNYNVLSPSGVPLLFLGADPLGDQGLINLDQIKGLMFSALDTQAVPLLVQMTIDFAETSTSGRSRMSNRAEVDGRPVISIAGGSLVALHSTNTIMGESGSVGVSKQVFLEGDYARVKSVDESPEALNAVASALGYMMAQPALIQGSERRFFIADPARYSELALKAGLAANRALVAAVK